MTECESTCYHLADLPLLIMYAPPSCLPCSRLGIHAGIEVLRVLEENGIETEFPVCVVNWTNEEGARFPKSVMSSSAWAGLISVKEAWELKEIPALAVGGDGKRLKTVKEELQRTGWLGDTRCDYREMPLGAHFELHIEQGPILERDNKSIGVVTGGQAYRWLTLSVRGKEAHTGTTPFADRSDALQASARIIVASRDIAQRLGGLCTTGVFHLQPGSTNTIPGAVTFSLDIRHADNDQVAKIEETLRSEVDRIVKGEGQCEAQWTMDTDSKAVDFHPDCIHAVCESAEETVGAERWIKMRSGAGHDSFATSTRCPTTMIFVPSRDGISHNEREYTSKRDCAVGAQVLLGAVLRYDQMRASGALRSMHTSATASFPFGSRRQYSTSRRVEEEKKGRERTPRSVDTRRYAKKYPPVVPLPEAINFDEPAVFNPIETAEAHTRFRKQAKWGGRVLAGAVLVGGILYFGLGVAHADEGKSVHPSTPFPERQITIDKDLEIPHEEFEKRIQDAQKELGTGSYAVLAIQRSTIIAKAVALCVWDYRKTLNKKYANREEEVEGLRQCHLRSAHRVLVALQENGGLYIKLGQHISSVILLPVEWTDTMKPLQDQNTPTPLAELETMFQAETGFTFDEAFSEIDSNRGSQSGAGAPGSGPQDWSSDGDQADAPRGGEVQRGRHEDGQCARQVGQEGLSTV
jgi:hydantoinase/carbamoylase family amidase